jgi:SMC interacting uncharacterized protein involved in chromosome segregation
MSPSLIAQIMEAVRTSETSVHFNVTKQRYIPEDFKLHTRRRENLMSHLSNLITKTWPQLFVTHHSTD